MAQLTPERWRRIDEVFREAARLNGKARDQFLDQECGTDADLRSEVNSLLGFEQSGGMLSRSPMDGLDTDELASAVLGWRPSEPQPEPPFRGAGPGSSDKTIGVFGASHIDPVVGWLVCVKGPDQGRDYRIRSERNRIGRGEAMDICIQGDPRVSRDTQAVITFEPRQNAFHLSPGQARGVVYLNGRLLDSATSLRADDIIELGDTELQFVPFCGERFQWK